MVRTIPPHSRAKLAVAGLLGLTAVVAGLDGAVGASGAPVDLSGADLDGWEMAVGDGVWLGPAQSDVTTADIAVHDLGTHSELVANVFNRGVMAHNIAFKRLTDLSDVSATHHAEVEFRLPELPTTSNWSYNAQTMEVGLFVWDGPDTRLDHGLAIQWVLNPWVAEFGQLRAWSQTESGPVWASIGYLAPDTEWHTLRLQYRPLTNAANLFVDNSVIPIDETFTTKHDDWGTTIDARFQVELVSVWPGFNPTVPEHRVQFRNWSWTTTAD